MMDFGGGINEAWTPELVKAALVDAFECDYDSGGRVGPKAFGSSMPEYLVSQGDLWWQRSSGSNTVGRMRVRIPRRAVEISRMEIVLLGHRDRDGADQPNWLGGLLGRNDGARNCLTIHAVNTAKWNLRQKDFNAKRFCQQIGLSYWTYRSRRDRGAEIIAEKLNEIGLRPWR